MSKWTIGFMIMGILGSLCWLVVCMMYVWQKNYMAALVFAILYCSARLKGGSQS